MSSTKNCVSSADPTNWKDNTWWAITLGMVTNLAVVKPGGSIIADAYNSALDDSKANNLASYQANYVKGSGTDKVDEYGYKLDGSDNKVKDGTYDVTLREKDWSYEKQSFKTK